MNPFSEMVLQIIQVQQKIIGPAAIDQAMQIEGLVIDWQNHIVTFSGDEKVIINQLVEVYKEFFGPASVETCKAAVKEAMLSLPPDRIPDSLR